MEDMSDWMVYLTNNYGLDYGHEYETLYWCSGLLSHGVWRNCLLSIVNEIKNIPNRIILLHF